MLFFLLNPLEKQEMLRDKKTKKLQSTDVAGMHKRSKKQQNRKGNRMVEQQNSSMHKSIEEPIILTSDVRSAWDKRGTKQQAGPGEQ